MTSLSVGFKFMIIFKSTNKIFNFTISSIKSKRQNKGLTTKCWCEIISCKRVFVPWRFQNHTFWLDLLFSPELEYGVKQLNKRVCSSTLHVDNASKKFSPIDLNKKIGFFSAYLEHDSGNHPFIDRF